MFSVTFLQITKLKTLELNSCRKFRYKYHALGREKKWNIWNINIWKNTWNCLATKYNKDGRIETIN